MSDEWNLYYARWLLNDGEEDRRVGEIFDWFALDFWTPSGLTKSQEESRTAVAGPDFHYRVSAEVIYLSKSACVIDFGLLAIGNSDQIPPGCKEGNYVAGQFRLNLPNCILGVPDELMPRLAHRWQVNGILADMAEEVLFSVNSQAPHWRESKIPYRDVASTADSGPCHGYILKCSQVE